MSEAGRVQREWALRAAVLAGDVRAWQASYADAFAAVHAYALWRCGGRADLADDLTQETCCSSEHDSQLVHRSK